MSQRNKISWEQESKQQALLRCSLISRDFISSELSVLFYSSELFVMTGNRDEKLLCHIAMVAKFLYLNKPWSC